MPRHAALIAVLLLDRPTCLDCIALKSGLAVTEVDCYLTSIATSLDLARNDRDRCRGCGNEGPVVSLSLKLTALALYSLRARLARPTDLARVEVVDLLDE
jgi:hypothetical protein